MTNLHNHDQFTDCTPPSLTSSGMEGCPAWGTPQEELAPTPDRLRLIAEADQADAAEETESREQASWRMHVEQNEAATFHNNALAMKHAALGNLYDTLRDAVKGLALPVAVAVIIRAWRR